MLLFLLPRSLFASTPPPASPASIASCRILRARATPPRFPRFSLAQPPLRLFCCVQTVSVLPSPQLLCRAPVSPRLFLSFHLVDSLVVSIYATFILLQVAIQIFFLFPCQTFLLQHCVHSNLLCWQLTPISFQTACLSLICAHPPVFPTTTTPSAPTWIPTPSLLTNVSQRLPDLYLFAVAIGLLG